MNLPEELKFTYYDRYAGEHYDAWKIGESWAVRLD